MPSILRFRTGNTMDSMFFVHGMRQQLYLQGDTVCRTAAVLREVAFRRAPGRADFLGRSITNATVWVSHAPFRATSMSNEFARNRVGPRIQVFRGNFNLPTIRSGLGVFPFDIRFKFSRPFAYFRRLGDVMLEFELPGDPNKFSEYWLDAEGSNDRAFVRPYGVSGRFASGEGSALRQGNAEPRIGGNVKVAVMPLLRSPYPTLLGIGVSRRRFGLLQLPFDLGPLGAPGNRLLTSLEVLFPVRVEWFVDGYGAEVQFPIPESRQLASARFFAQAIHLDRRSNSLGVVMSDAVEIQLESWFPFRTLSGQFNTATGHLDRRMPATELVGTFN